MTDDEAAAQLAAECPRKILGVLHAAGHYLHCTSARYPGRVLCYHRESDMPDDCAPTPAQAHFLAGGTDR